MEYETYADVIDAYNADNMGYSTLTDYIKGQNIKIKEIEMDPIGDMQKIFENKADGGMIGIEVLFKEKMKDGGRAGFFMGGTALEGQALQIYNSMNAYGFSDQEIADVLSARGLYTPAGSGTTTQPEQVTGIINQQIQTGGGGDGGPQNIPEPKKYYDKTYTGMTFPDGSPIMGGFQETEGPGFLDSIANAFDGLVGLYQKFSPIGMIGRKIEQNKQFKQAQTNKALEQVAMQRRIREAEEARKIAEAAELARIENERRSKIGAQLQAASEAGGGYQPTTRAQNVSRTASRRTDKGIGQGGVYGLADGGLATMFTRRR